MSVDSTDKTLLDVFKALGVDTAGQSYAMIYSCHACGTSFTKHEVDPGLPSEEEYGNNLMELIFD